ncbi:MAG: hypothetical protein L0H84_15655 [Pseudonocardia sp.]|nr:hypothetical protein [Pseudonocardia sp.]
MRRAPRVALSMTPLDDPFEPISIRGRVLGWVEGDPAWEIGEPERQTVGR